ncbi:BTB/POZ domain-containing protein 6-like [Topomyia yanbarensis]|uniref:BTB/POZ domain-containing protein 6-like n=1 Tax=Topomyia yanbarensis TaxID=2498891 RepID=UPI00273C722E|nr:BTB/POZ domain-containing protein 6-like [Topomyia yanbarensis]
MSLENAMPTETRELAATFPVFKKPATNRREILFNNEFMSDVTLLVGPDRQRIHGHKMILISASDHFFELFQNSTINEITLEDVEPSIILELLRFLYCEKIQLTGENVREIYTQSKKWSLEKVLEAVDTFLNQCIDADNVLKKLMENRFYELKSIDETCLQIICDNPFRYFEQKDFAQLDRKSLSLVVSAKRINCSSDQLMDVLDVWQKTHPEEDVDDLRFVIRSSNPHPAWDQLKFFGALSQTSPGRFPFFIKSKNIYFRGIQLTGLGVFFKSRVDTITATVEIYIHDTKNYVHPPRDYTFKNPCPDTVNTTNIFFEPFEMETNVLYWVSVTFKTLVEQFSIVSHQTYHSQFELEIFQENPSYLRTYPTAVAHFIYKEVK